MSAFQIDPWALFMFLISRINGPAYQWSRTCYFYRKFLHFSPSPSGVMVLLGKDIEAGSKHLSGLVFS